ncbi:MAG: hypothetical protein ABUT39_19845 [Acidobacteriota bacterium]
MSTNELAGLGDLTLAAQENTDAGQDLAAAGASFGALMLGVGNAVAATQQNLTETSADTTSTLAQTLVDVIAVQETIYDDFGTITGSKSYTQKLPLLNFIDPVFYQYPQVKIEGRFVIDSLATDASSSTDTSTNTFGMGFSLSRTPTLFGGSSYAASGGAGATSTSQSTKFSVQTNAATAVGQMRMFAQLAPQPGLGVPKPTQVIVGPSLSIIEGEITEEDDADGNTLRTLSLLIQLRNKDGQPIGGKAISIDTDGVPWSFEDEDATTTGQSGADAGNVSILLKRTFPAPATAEAAPVDKSPKQSTVNVRLGLVANGLTVTF